MVTRCSMGALAAWLGLALAAAAAPPAGENTKSTGAESTSGVPYRALTRGFFHPAMAEVMGLTDEQRQATSLMLLWFMGMAMDIAQSTSDLEQAAPALAMLELFMEDLLASVLSPDQLKFWDQMFGTAPQGQTVPGLGRR